ncbi:hypothetical protein Fcan01_24932 [Folsomia candida]|uniref:Uncharacterized protein n=1 Tax=Folsomia candida TaxID=158441 RepID=A0A226D4W1_FOLCA|nr:hypothetical protein Fcan01_24932 [Folsomia candida]
MGVTPLVWRALDRFKSYFSLLWTHPNEWDVTQKKLVITPISTKLISWMISVFVFLNMLNIVSLCLLVGKLFGFVRLSLSGTLVALGWWVPATFAFFIEVLGWIFAESGVNAFNCISSMEQKLWSHLTRPSPPTPDWTGIALNKLIDLLFAQAIFLYIYLVLICRLDPYYQLESILPALISLPVKFLLHLFRVTMWIPIFQVARISAFIISTATIAAYLALSCISALEKAATSRKTWKNSESIATHLLNYASCQLVFGIGYDFYISIYLHAPLIAGIIAAAMVMMLPLCTDIYENSKEIHATWRNGMVGVKNDVKYLRRKLRSIQVIALYGGINGYNLYKCTRSMISAYFSAVISYTITATLSIDLTRSLNYLER